MYRFMVEDLDIVGVDDAKRFRRMLAELDLAYKGTPMEHILPLMLIANVFGDGKSVEETLSMFDARKAKGCPDVEKVNKVIW